MTVYWPLKMTGAGRLVVQIEEPMLVLDCRVKPVPVVGHDKRTFWPEKVIVNCGMFIDPK